MKCQVILLLAFLAVTAFSQPRNLAAQTVNESIQVSYCVDYRTEWHFRRDRVVVYGHCDISTEGPPDSRDSWDMWSLVLS